MTGPETPLERARVVLGRYAENDPTVDEGCLAAALADLIREHEILADAFRDRDMVYGRLLGEHEQMRATWIDPERLERLTAFPTINIRPMDGVSMAGDRWIITGGYSAPGRRIEYARTFPEALAIAEARR